MGRYSSCGSFVGDTMFRMASSECMPKPDMVDAPAHYTRLDPEPIEVIEKWGMDFFTGSALKYIARAGFKEGQSAVTDLRKAISFLNRKVLSLEGKPVTVSQGYGPGQPKVSDQ